MGRYGREGSVGSANELGSIVGVVERIELFDELFDFGLLFAVIGARIDAFAVEVLHFVLKFVLQLTDLRVDLRNGSRSRRGQWGVDNDQSDGRWCSQILQKKSECAQSTVAECTSGASKLISRSGFCGSGVDEREESDDEEAS